MKIPKIYLETTVFNFVFYDKEPEKQADTIKLFKEINEGKFQPFTSEYVTGELENASVDKRTKMVGLIAPFNVNVLKKSNEINRLAETYIIEGIIPKKHETDALHIAAATVNDLDIIVSWNFRHIVKRKTILMTESVNLRYGYKKVEIYSPSAVIDNG
jgi:predicted nucleic acid-binding protein